MKSVCVVTVYTICMSMLSSYPPGMCLNNSKLCFCPFPSLHCSSVALCLSQLVTICTQPLNNVFDGIAVDIWEALHPRIAQSVKLPMYMIDDRLADSDFL